MKIKRAYRQGRVITKDHPVLNENQIVEITFEGYDFYNVQNFHTGKTEKIKKEDLQLD